jgi:hypothetical protein
MDDDTDLLFDLHRPATRPALIGGAEPQTAQPFVPTHSEIKTSGHTAMKKARREPAPADQLPLTDDRPSSA